MSNAIITNQPPKGTYDWLPEEFKVRKYIFDTWREVCTSFGYQEYLTPLLEYADIYRVKSGEDVGGKELTIITDRGGRELALRPEMTPSVTRLVTKVYQESAKPIRLFSIANFYRNEAPQKGRNREFWQLNFDIFGTNSINADIEIIQMGIEIMKKFKSSEDMFEVRLNDRKIIDYILSQVTEDCEKKIELARLMDKYIKLTDMEFREELDKLDIGDLDIITDFLKSKSLNDLDIPNEIKSNLNQVITKLTQLGFGNFLKFDPTMIRGFDYYDGTVFEFFDKNSENTRSLFGGGRYNGLAKIFGLDDIPAVGMAPGDEPMKLFLTSWNLLPDFGKDNKTIYMPMLVESVEVLNKVKNHLVQEGYSVTSGLEIEKMSGNMFAKAEKLGFKFVAIVGEDEIKKSNFVLKNLKTREESKINI